MSRRLFFRDYYDVIDAVRSFDTLIRDIKRRIYEFPRILSQHSGGMCACLAA